MPSAHQIGDLVGNYTTWEAGGKKGLTLNTEAVNVIWGGELSKSRYWKAGLDGSTQVLELLGVYWLEISGKVPLSLLSPNTKYSLVFNIKLTPAASGWEKCPVVFKVSLPGKKTYAAHVNLHDHMDLNWVDVPEGLQFSVPEDNSGKLAFAMYEIEGGEWKKGLSIREIRFIPETTVTINI